mgnify:CR=1 FL=1
MEINKKKSGILILKGDKDRKFGDYPKVDSYRYLGLHMDADRQVSEHLKHINKKSAYITYCLRNLRNLDNLKLNSNLFHTFITPNYRLTYAKYKFAD